MRIWNWCFMKRLDGIYHVCDLFEFWLYISRVIRVQSFKIRKHVFLCFEMTSTPIPTPLRFFNIGLSGWHCCILEWYARNVFGAFKRVRPSNFFKSLFKLLEFLPVQIPIKNALPSKPNIESESGCQKWTFHPNVPTGSISWHFSNYISRPNKFFFYFGHRRTLDGRA